ncbi:MAG: DUF885 family protein, partial [Telluria sp.]
MMRRSLTAIAVACFFACTASAQAAPGHQPAHEGNTGKSQAATLQQLGDRYYAAVAGNAPLFATLTGDARYNDRLGLAIAPEQRARHVALMRKLQKSLSAIASASLSTADQTSYAMLAYEIKREIAAHAFPDHLMPVDQMMFSPPLWVASLADGQGSQAISTPQEYRIFLARMKQLTPWLDQAIVNMRAGIKAGIV